MKKLIRWTLVVLLTPVLLFLLLAVLLYLPPVQNWAVDKVAAVVSEKTGMTVSVGTVRLEWPLDLGIDDFLMVHEGDTLADVGHLSADVQLRPLFSKRIVINELSVSDARLNTNGFISDLRVKGRVGELWLASKGIDLDRETVEVNGARLEGADLDVALSDTAAVDTTTSTVRWRVNADSLTVLRTRVALHMPGDTLNVKAYMGQAVAREADIDIGTSTYRVGSFDWHDGQLAYDDLHSPTVEGLDYNHLSLTDIRLGVDSIYYGPKGTSFFVRQTAMKEKSGLEVTHLSGGVRLDTAFTHVEVPHMILRTADSDMEGELDMDFSTFDETNPGKMHARLNAQIGKQDVLRFAGDLPQKFLRQYPNSPIAIKGSVNGNMQRMEVTGLDVSLPTAFHLTADGVAHNVNDMDRLKAQFAVKAETQNMDFVASLLPTTDLRIPAATLQGDFKADGKDYAADFTAREGQGTVRAKGHFNAVTETYDADVSVRQLNVHHFLPHDSIYTVTADAKLHGHGLDFLHAGSRLDADMKVTQLRYGHWNLDDIVAQATLKNGRGQVALTGHNQLIDGKVNVDALLSTKRIEAVVETDVQLLDLYRLRLTDEPLAIGMKGTVNVASDMKQDHQVKGLLGSLYIKDKDNTFTPEDLGVFLQTNRDTTRVRLQSGNLIVKVDGSGGYERLLNQSTRLMDSLKSQLSNRIIDQPAIKRLLPEMKLYVSSGRDNPLAALLRTKDISFKEILLDLSTSPVTGINGEGHVYALNIDSTRLDTVRLQLRQKGDRITYSGQVRNNRRNPQFVFNALIDGHVHEHGALAGLRYYDDRDRLGVRIGATAEMEEEGLRFRLLPDRPTLGYKEFNLNKDNFIFLGKDKKIQANIDLIADDKTGLKIYSMGDTDNPLDLTVSVNMLDLGELTAVVPYLPRITGQLNGDYHIIRDEQGHISAVSDMAVAQMTYEGSPIGNISTELVYLLKDDDTHAIEARLMLDDEEFGLLNGTYYAGTSRHAIDGQGTVDATLTMTRFPLSLANGYVPDLLIGLEGYGEGELTIKGTAQHPKVDGEIMVEDAYLVSLPYGVRMRFDDDPVRIVGSHLLLENFGLYAYNEEPLVMMGDIDFSDTEHVKMDMQMRARNLLLINAKQQPRSLAFGKAFVNFFARMQGPIESLRMRGRLDVLGSTDMTYMLLDSPLSTDNRLEELVKFTDFSDTTQTIVTRPVPTGLDADLNISISQGARVVCNLNADQTNYVDLTGGGELRMRYNAEGINLTGRYTLGSSEMKYSLPVIPLKTFTIKEGSYVEFTGNPMNPRLNITATERTKATVSDPSGSSRSVAFDCGVVITKTLNDMGLQFVIEAPEDNAISGELQTMSAEERGKVAVTMLTTGMYLADGNTSNFSMNSALSSFLQGEINNIAGSALKTLDVQLGIDNTTDATGAMHTDYSFRFAKRFMNNRLRLQIGGKVSSGNTEAMGQNQSFFDNVTMEYRLNQDATQNVKLFYNQNVYDWLEGYTGEYGVGYVWRRKLDSLWDVFKKNRSTQVPPNSQGTQVNMRNEK